MTTSNFFALNAIQIFLLIMVFMGVPKIKRKVHDTVLGVKKTALGGGKANFVGFFFVTGVSSTNVMQSYFSMGLSGF